MDRVSTDRACRSRHRILASADSSMFPVSVSSMVRSASKVAVRSAQKFGIVTIPVSMSRSPAGQPASSRTAAKAAPVLILVFISVETSNRFKYPNGPMQVMSARFTFFVETTGSMRSRNPSHKVKVVDPSFPVSRTLRPGSIFP